MTHEEKLKFVTVEFPNELLKIDPNTPPLFGKMNFQQMLEHMSDSVRVANGKTKFDLHTEQEKLPLFRAFVLSDKEFKPNTKNALMGEEPLAIRNTSLKLAFDELNLELDDFIKYFAPNPSNKLMNPFFGPFDFQEWTHLLHKHSTHHLNQFRY